MPRCPKLIAHVCLLFLAVISLTKLPAYAQRGTIDIEAGQTSDKFGGLARTTAAEVGIDGEGIVIQGNHKDGMPDIVAGGEIRLPADTSAHAPEFAAYAGPMFWAGSHFRIGFHAQVRKIYRPTSEVNGVFFTRDRMMLLELPAVLECRFGGAARHAFIEGQISPEFSPHYTAPSGGPATVPNPTLDHGYSIRGSAGFTFGKWYAKATYATRYFKFAPVTQNPYNLYNWRTDFVTGGVGIVF
jgi:hypothetical protein